MGKRPRETPNTMTHWPGGGVLWSQTCRMGLESSVTLLHHTCLGGEVDRSRGEMGERNRERERSCYGESIRTATSGANPKMVLR